MVLQEIRQLGRDLTYGLGHERYLLNDLGGYKTKQILLDVGEGLRSRLAYYQAKFPNRLYVIVDWE